MALCIRERILGFLFVCTCVCISGFKVPCSQLIWIVILKSTITFCFNFLIHSVVLKLVNNQVLLKPNPFKFCYTSNKVWIVVQSNCIKCINPWQVLSHLRQELLTPSYEVSASSNYSCSKRSKKGKTKE